MDRRVFLTKGKNDIVVSGNYGDGIYASPVYRFDNKLCKIMANLCVMLNLPILNWFLGDWSRKLSSYDLIICEGLKRRSWVFEYILKHKQNDTRLVMWHWNKIFEHEISPESELASKCEQWSFDPDDCKKYHMNYNTQYFATISIPFDTKIKRDLYFLGADKGRKPLLEKMKMYCEQAGISTYFHIVADENSSDNSDTVISYMKPISYDKNIENVSDCKAIVDLPLAGQDGLTLRVMEALYLEKKLISFNQRVRELPFYNSQNIMVCDSKDKIDVVKLKKFLCEPYQETEECKEAKMYYSFQKWMKRF